MGFYAPAQLVRDARAHGVRVLPVCVEHSYWDNVLEPADDGALAVRLGFRQIRGFKEEDGLWIAAARANGYHSIETLWRRAGLKRSALSKLAEADAFSDYGLNRREALWQVKGLGGETPLPLFSRDGEGMPEITAPLPSLSNAEDVFEDYISMRLTLREHSLSLLRPQIGSFANAASMRDTPDGQWVTLSGLVITRQRPGTSSGVIFLTIEDDTATANIIVWPKMFEKFRRIVMAGRLLRIRGRLQREGIVTHVIATHIEDKSWLLDTLGDPDHAGGEIEPTRDNADDVKHPIPLREGDPRTTPRPLAGRSISEEQQKAQMIRYGVGARHPREQAKKLFYSRDFH